MSRAPLPPTETPMPLALARRVDQVCRQFETAWRAGGRPPIADYLAEVPECDRPVLLEELLGIALELRQEQGERPTPGEYHGPFPEYTALIEAVFRQAALDAVKVSIHFPHLRQVAHYQLLEEVGRGGMGAVYWARDTELGRDLAVKVLLDDQRAGPAGVRRFVEEAHIGARLQHPGIPPVHELGRLPDGRPFIAMKLVRGQTLAALLTRRADPREDRLRFLDVFDQVCQTLAYVHSRGVIHRDLKPANVMVGTFGEVQVMDWGLAKQVREPADSPGPKAGEPETGIGDPDRTRSGSILGTPAYMAPEQALGDVDRVDERTDVFGLGTILAEILTGKPPFIGKDGAQILDRARRADLEEIWARLDGCDADPELVNLTKLCLAAEPSERPRDAAVVAAEFTAYRSRVQERLHAAELTAVEARAKSAHERKTRRLTVALAATVVAAVLAAAAAWIGTERGRQQRLAGTNRQVQEALSAALALQEQAREATTDLAPWTEAREMARQAVTLVEGGPADPGLARRTHELYQELDREVADRRFVRRLDEMRLRAAEGASGTNQYPGPADNDYREAFSSWGMPVVDTNAEDAAACIRDRSDPVRGALLAGLDDWLAACLAAGVQRRAWLQDVIRASDAGDARTRLRVAVARWDLPAAYRLLGISYAATRRTDDAIAAHRQVLRVPADNPRSYQVFGRALAYAGFFDEAVCALRKALRLEPADDITYRLLAHSLLAVGEQDEALAHFLRSATLKPNAVNAYLDFAVALTAHNAWETAFAVFSKALDLAPNDHELLRLATIAALQAGNQEGYDRHRRRMLDRFGASQEPFTAERTATACLLAAAAGKTLRQATALADRALTVRDAPWHLPYCQFAKGLAEYRNGRLDSAGDWFRKALALNLAPKQQPQLVLAMIHYRQGRQADALRELTAARREVGKMVPNDVVLGLWQVQVLLREAETLIELEPQMGSLRRGEWKSTGPADRLALARLCFQNRRYPLEAARLFREAFDADPTLAENRASGNRFQAACCAALAAFDPDQRTPLLNDPERTGWQSQSLAWLNADLAQLGRLAESSDPKDHQTVREELGTWQRDARLAGMRDGATLAQLSQSEQEACRTLWTAVAAVVVRVPTP